MDTAKKTITIDDYFKNRHQEIYGNSKQANIKVWKNTQHLFTKGQFKKCKPPLSQGYSVNWELDHETTVKRFDSTSIRVWNCDTLVGAKRMIEEGLKPLVLNMASNFVAGGGVRKGSRAQEECLFRRSNYFLTLDTRRLPRHTYPLEHSTAIYSPGVYVVKGTDNSILNKEERFYVDFIAIAGLRRPKLNNLKTSFLFDNDRVLLKERVERIYQVGIDQGHDSMLLGALGCGAFKNPVEEVVQVFKEVGVKYDGYFKQIDFAVLSEEGNPNFTVFNQQLSNVNVNQSSEPKKKDAIDPVFKIDDFPPLK